MVINWYGKTCFKIIAEGGSLLINPPSKKTGLTKPRGEVEALLFSEEAPSKDEWKNYLKKETKIIQTPGEFDVDGFFILGMAPNGGEIPSLFIIETEKKTICHIGSYPHPVITDDHLEKLGKVDVLMIPVGGIGKDSEVIDAERAAKITNQMEPSIVIPTYYKTKGFKEKVNNVDKFLKELGASDTTSQGKLSISKRDRLSDEETKVVVIES